ncbi:hypothetical protein BDN72DRAFT_768209 [Pluteus cervinus]|uniref:Uncharacterized protein n=1 Tax=Pluteus cervinus TaxID=181527 RepID=A0ACD3ATC6_9AGAR|nr:hypothetical protein BDN72DRAFT_768209 [Pluteus cervinus]
MHRHFERRNRIEATRVANPDDSGDDGDAGRFHHAIEALRDGPNNPTRSRQLIDRFHQDRASSAADTSRRNSSSNWGSILDDDWTSGLEAFGARRHRFPRATPRATPNRYSRWGRSDFSLRAVGDYVVSIPPPFLSSITYVLQRDEDFDTSYEGLMSLTAALGEVKPKNTPDKVVEEMEAAHYKDWATTESDRRCPICLDDYQPSDPVLKLNNCSHWLHQECLKQWLRGANTCPVCRKNVKIPSSSPRPPPRPGPSRRRDDHDPSGPGGSGSGRGNSSRLQPPYSIFFSWGDSDSP